MLNLIVQRCLFLTRKLNHCVYPPEFISFCKIKSYSYSPVWMWDLLPCMLLGDYRIQSWNQTAIDFPHLEEFYPIFLYATGNCLRSTLLHFDGWCVKAIYQIRASLVHKTQINQIFELFLPTNGGKVEIEEEWVLTRVEDRWWPYRRWDLEVVLICEQLHISLHVSPWWWRKVIIITSNK